MASDVGLAGQSASLIQVANGTAIEKANRISEVLLAIVRTGRRLKLREVLAGS